MPNRDTEAAWTYHNETKHSYHSVRNNPHFLDWPNQPRPFKIYRGLKPLPLPKEISETNQPALSVIRHAKFNGQTERPVTVRDLAAILFYAAGITRRRRYPGGEVLFRAAACTGALYSIELYAVCGELDDLKAGIYLFSPNDFSLRCIRSGDYRHALVRATMREASVANAPVTIVCTGTYWRNAWKYQSRTYRHFGWDNGTILANLLAVAAARDLPARVVNGFADQEVNHLLGLETGREVSLNLVPLGRTSRAFEPNDDAVPPLALETEPYSHHEVDYPAMRQMHAASSLSDPEEIAGWRGNTPVRTQPAPAAELIPLDPVPEADLPRDSIERVILRRGSSRRFLREPISFKELSTALFCATQGVPADFLAPPGNQMNDLYLVVHAVEGIKPGAYFLYRHPWALELLKEGDFRKRTGYLGLEQDLPADCSAAVFFLADLNPLLERFGNRAYRAVQVESGIIGGRLYLAAYAQRLGATGLTFYDDEVTNFFSPHSEGKSAIFLVALGRSASRIRSFP